MIEVQLTLKSHLCGKTRGFPGTLVIKSLPAILEIQVWSLDREDPLEEEMATHSSILVWKIMWTEELGRVQCIGFQRVRHDWSNLACMLKNKDVHGIGRPRNWRAAFLWSVCSALGPKCVKIELLLQYSQATLTHSCKHCEIGEALPKLWGCPRGQTSPIHLCSLPARKCLHPSLLLREIQTPLPLLQRTASHFPEARVFLRPHMEILRCLTPRMYQRLVSNNDYPLTKNSESSFWDVFFKNIYLISE